MKAQFVTSSKDIVKLKKFHIGKIGVPHLLLNTDSPKSELRDSLETGTFSEKTTFPWQVGWSGFCFTSHLPQAVERVECWSKAKMTLQTCTVPTEMVRMVRRCDFQLPILVAASPTVDLITPAKLDFSQDC